MLAKAPYKRRFKNHEQEIRRTGEDSSLSSAKALYSSFSTGTTGYEEDRDRPLPAEEISYFNFYQDLVWLNW